MSNRAQRANESPLSTLVKFLILMFIVLSAVSVQAGVLVSPTVVFISDRSPSGQMTIVNQDSEPQEVTINFSFGLPESDSLGNVIVTFQDSAVTDPRSALNWVRAFPRTFILQPSESQIVRIMARPPAEIEAGEYWARVMVSSKKTTTPVQMIDVEQTIGTQIHMVSRQAVMMKYRKGDLSCSLELTDARARQEGNLVHVMVDLVNRGNVSYMGTLDCKLIDREQREVSHNSLKMAIYRDLRRRIDLPILSDRYKPPFKVVIRISNEGRNDVMPQDMIKGNTIDFTAIVD